MPVKQRASETFRAMDPALLILDLDETLVYARHAAEGHGYSFQVAKYFVSVRPHLSEFLESVFNWFSVAVWTSAGEDYGQQVIAEVFPNPEALEFCWFANRCTRAYDPELREHFIVKDLKKVRRAGFPLERVLMIDDTSSKLKRHYGNHLPIKPFLGDPSDTELLDVLPFLNWIRGESDFRAIEKRNWRTHSSTQT
jgi:RNA polymerase II subunit A small phosphatase-like protein